MNEVTLNISFNVEKKEIRKYLMLIAEYLTKEQVETILDSDFLDVDISKEALIKGADKLKGALILLAIGQMFGEDK